MNSVPGRFYFWGERALFLGPGLPAAVHAHHAVQVCIALAGKIYSSDLLRTFCDIVGIRNAFTSFDYLQRGEREGLRAGIEPLLVSA
jgi:hypothetical protein